MLYSMFGEIVALLFGQLTIYGYICSRQRDNNNLNYTIMRTINYTLLEEFVRDNRQYAADYETVAEYVLANCEMPNDYTPFLEEDATEEEIEEFTNYVNENYDFPAYTYDVVFNDSEDGNSNDFKLTLQGAKDYISAHNGTDHGYFANYKGGTVEIIENETGETVYSEEVR